MNIIQAAKQKTVLEAALAYHDLGISVVPVVGKVCHVSWTRYQTSIAPYSHIHAWYKRGMMHGVGIVCGEVSGGPYGSLVVIDLDGLDAVAEFRATFPHLLNTYTVRSGSGEGQHLYYYTDAPHDTTRTTGFELRSDGSYVVAPPSLHPKTGETYGVEHAALPMDLPNLNVVEDWIKSKIKRPMSPRRVKTKLPPVYGGSTKPRRFVEAYCNSALHREMNHVRYAVRGQRNDSLYHAARRLGSLLASPDVRHYNALTRSNVESLLETAAAKLSADDGIAATRRTIHSGIERGLTTPFDLPEPRPLRNQRG